MTDETERPPRLEQRTAAGVQIRLESRALERYAGRTDLPVGFHYLVVFGIILVLALGAAALVEPLTMGILAGVLLAVYLGERLITRGEARRSDPLTLRDEKLARFLGIPETGGVVSIYVPIHEADHRPEGAEPYRVRSVPLAHVQAVVELASLLSHLSPPDAAAFEPQNLFVDEAAVDSFRGSTMFLIGGPLPNVFVARMLEENPHLELEDRVDRISLRCAGLPADRFVIHPARAERTITQVEREPTYGVVQKIAREGRTTFAVWGLDERGTRGAARWLATSWSQAAAEFRDRDFTAIVQLPPGRTYAPDAVARHPDRQLPFLVPP